MELEYQHRECSQNISATVKVTTHPPSPLSPFSFANTLTLARDVHCCDWYGDTLASCGVGGDVVLWTPEASTADGSESKG